MAFLQDVGKVASIKRDIMNEVVMATDLRPYKKMEELYGELKKASMEESFTMMDKKAQKIFRKIGDILEETFNFKEVLFINAGPTMTLSPRFSVDLIDNIMDRKVIKTPTGLAFAEKKYKTLIFIGDQVVRKCTPGELVAGTLHEVGHAFDESFGSKISLLSPSTYGAAIVCDLVKYIVSKVDIQDGPVRGVYAAGKRLTGYALDILDHLYQFLPRFMPRDLVMSYYIIGALNKGGDMFKNILLLQTTGVFKRIDNILDFRSEVNADYFAASCGYGTEMASYVSKMDNSVTDRIIENHPITGVMFSFFSIIEDLIVEIDGPHAVSIDRMKLVRKYLIQARDESIDPKAKAHLTIKVEDMDKLIAARASKDNMLFSRVLASVIRGKNRANLDDIQDLRYIAHAYQTEFGNLA